MSRTDLDLSDERLGEALGRAMDRHVRAETAQRGARTAGVAEVRAGARRRQNTRRVALSTACVGLIAVAGVAMVNRTGSTDPVTPASQPEPATALPILPAFASLDASTGFTPQALYADVGGGPNGAQLPAVDVWTAGDETIVVRTWAATTASTDPSTASTLAETATTVAAEFPPNEPWRDRAVERITVRDVAGAVEQLADDQFEFWIPSSTSDAYAVVAVRGLGRAAALAVVEDLDDTTGVLQPTGGFTRTEQVSGTPVSAPSGAFAQVSYGLEGGPFVVSWAAPTGATTVEGTLLWPGSRKLEVDGREIFIRANFDRVDLQWLDPSGVVVNIGYIGAEAEAIELAGQVRMIDQTAFTAIASTVSSWVRQQIPVTSSVELGGLQIERRNDAGRIALCVGSSGSERQCAAAQDVNGGVIDLGVVIDGRWYAVGYRPHTDDDFTPDMDALSFDLDGTGTAGVEWRSTDEGLWYVADLGIARTSTTNLGSILGGISGTISRPVVPSTFG
jgi:hypothetical protein